MLGDNQLHYTALRDFAFFAHDIDDLCDRLQANTNRWCESNGFELLDYWRFITPSKDRTVQRLGMLRKENGVWVGLDTATATQIWTETYGGSFDVDEEKKDVNVQISNTDVWNSLKIIKEQFGLNFISRGRSVIIGSAGIPTNHIFEYGKDNGLYEIEKTADSEQQVITKLFAYGSEKNMPVRYYANLNIRCYGEIEHFVIEGGFTYIMLNVPFERAASFFTNKGEYGGIKDGYLVNVDDDNSHSCQAVVSSAEKLVESILENTEARYPYLEEYTDDKYSAFTYYGTPQEYGAMPLDGTVFFDEGINKDKWISTMRIVPTNLPNNMAVGYLMLPGFPLKSLYQWVKEHGGTNTDDATGRATWKGYTAYFSKDQYQPYIVSLNADTLGIRETARKFDGSDEEEVYPTIENTDKDSLYSAEMMSDNGVFTDGDKTPTVDMVLKFTTSDLNLKELAATGTQDGGTPTITMKDGYCGSMDFKFTADNISRDNNRWKIRCERYHNELLGIFFPYSYSVSQGGEPSADEAYQLRGGDKFVITGIPMPDYYISMASEKLLEKALIALSKNDYTRFTYQPKVDELYMVRQHNDATASHTRSLYMTLKEGDIMLFADGDLGVADGRVFIDTLSIHEDGNNGIPTYEVTLRNDKSVGTIQRLQEKVDSLVVGTAVSGNGNTSGVSAAQIRPMIETYGEQIFLSKTKKDSAAEEIGFLKGLWVKTKGLFGIAADGNAKVNGLEAAGDATVNGDTEVKGNLTVGGIFTALLAKINSISSSNFSGHTYTGEGWAITNNYENGRSRLTVDELYVRARAIFEELVIKQKQVSGGDSIESCAASYISRVDYLDANGNPMGYTTEKVPWTLNGVVRFLTNALGLTQILAKEVRMRRPLTDAEIDSIDKVRCYFLASDGARKIENWWQVGDLAYCKTLDLDSTTQQQRDEYAPPSLRTKLGNISWWRQVYGVSSSAVTLDDGKQYHYFDVKYNHDKESKATANLVWCELHSDIPATNDAVVQLGHIPPSSSSDTTATDRMNALSIEINGAGNEDAPCVKMLYGIYTYSLTKCWFGGRVDRMKLSPKTGYEFYGPSFKQVTMYDTYRVPTDKGLWNSIPQTRDDYTPHANVRKCYFYDRVSHNGSLWLCRVPEGQHWIVDHNTDTQHPYQITYNGVTYNEGDDINSVYDSLPVADQMKCIRVENYTSEEPGSNPSSTVWEKQVEKGDRGESITKQSEVAYYIKNTTGVRPAADDPSWSTTKPTLNEGEWLFTKTVITWSDGSTTVLYTDERNPNDGVNGQDIIVDGATEMKYAVSNNNTTQPTTWYNYADIVSQIVPGKWLWTKATTYYRKASSAAGSHDAGSSTNYSVGYIGTNGTNGRAVSAVSEHYNISNSSSTSWNVPSSGTWAGEWSTDPNQSSWGDNNKYLWNYEKIIYTNSDGSTTISRTAPSVVAVWTKDGKGIDSIINYYKITNNLTPPSRIDEGGSGWDDDPIAPTSENPYLWNYEKIHWTDNTDTYTDVQMIGHFGSDGANGLFYVEDYGRSKSRTSVASPNLDTSYGTNGWGATAPSPTDVYPYIWKRSRQYNPNTQTYGTASYVCETGEKGINGKDGWMITAYPANVILTESRSNNQSTFTTAVVSFTAKKGGVNATITGISTPTSAEFIVSKNGSSGTAAKQVRVTSPNTSGGSYYTEGSFKVNVYVTDPDTNQSVTFNDVTVPCYANLLGTWQESIENGVKTEIGELTGYSDLDPETGVTLKTHFEAEITKSAQGLTQKFTEEVVKNQNLFGFNKDIKWDLWPSVKFIQGYGLVINQNQTSDGSTCRRARISNIGFNGVGGLFVVSFEAKIVSDTGSLYVNLCDQGGILGKGSLPSDSSNVTLTTSWKSYEVYFDLSNCNAKFLEGPYDPYDGKYNGFLDFEALSVNDRNIYIRHLKIERGDHRTGFNEADEDLGYRVNDELITSITKYSSTSPSGPSSLDGHSNIYTRTVGTGSTINYLTSNSVKLKEGRIYTLSFWAKSTVDGFCVKTVFDGSMGGSAIGVIWAGDGTGYVKEGVYTTGETTIVLSTTWKQYFVHLYVTTAAENTFSLFKQATGNTESATVYIGDYHLMEGYFIDPSEYKSLVEQTARRISMMQYTGDKKVGVTLEDGKMTCIGDGFEWQNQDGEQVMGLDNQGNATFKGVIRSGGIYQNIDFYDTSNAYHQYRWIYEDGHVREKGEYVAPEEYSEHIDDGYVMINCEYIGCGLLDVVYLRNEWPDNNCIYIPNPQGLAGKQMEIYKGNATSEWKIGTDPHVANSTFFDATYRQGTIASNYIALGATTIYVRLVSNGSVWYILERRDVYGNIPQ